MIANSSPASALTASRNGGTKPPKRQKARPVRSGVSAGQDGITAVKSAGHSMSRTNEYLTWLDWYASGAAEKLVAAGYPQARDIDDAEAAWVICLKGLTEIDDADRPPRDDEAWDAPSMSQYVCMLAIASIIAPTGQSRKHWTDFFADNPCADQVMRGGKGLKLSSRLVRLFSHAKAPKTQDWQPLAQGCNWYLDLPHRALMLRDTEVRAIFTYSNVRDELVSAVAILTEPDSNEAVGRYAWPLLPESKRGPGCADIDVDALELQRRANDFIALSLLYYQSLEHCEALPRRQTGPHLSKIQRKLERKTKSLFVVHNLPDPVGNLGRPVEPVEAGEAGGWHLDHRVTVRGHFRWQPVGEGRSHRELRWIAEHHRGIDLPEKPQLIPLRRPNT